MESLLKKASKKIQGPNLFGFLKAATLDRRVLVFCHDVIALFAAMQLSMWFVLSDELQLLAPGFILKESVIFALIASGFFLWFQTYKGIWRYVSWRQSALLVGVLGFASLIFFPLLTKAHMQPIAIPAVTVLVNWGVASALLIGSRVFFRVFHERWSVADESLLTDSPMARVILVGGGVDAKQFLKNLQGQKTHLYDVLGYVESHPTGEGALEGVDILGSLADLPDLIENFNSEGIHPHHLIFTDGDYLGPKARALLKNLSAFKVSFMKTHDEDASLSPLTIEDVFHERIPEFSVAALENKTVLLYGASCALGQEVAKMLVKSPCAKVILWDQNTSVLASLAEGLKSEKVRCFSKVTCGEEQLASYLKEQKVDLFLNLKAFSALEMEPYDPSLSFEVYVEENERFSAACQKAGVGHYCFITQEAPHGVLATQLSPVAGHLLKVQQSKANDSTFAAINLPYVLAKTDPFFQGQHQYTISQPELSVVSSAYGAQMLGQIMVSIMNKAPWKGGDFHMETLSYEALAEMYARLNHDAPAPTYRVNSAISKTITWDEDHYKKVQQALKNMDYKGAAENLESFYA